MNLNSMIGWHFVGETLSDGTDIPKDNETLLHKGVLIFGVSGLHFGLTPFNALAYAPGWTLCKVQVDDFVLEGGVGVARQRTILERHDVSSMVLMWAAEVLEDALLQCNASQRSCWNMVDFARDVARGKAYDTYDVVSRFSHVHTDIVALASMDEYVNSVENAVNAAKYLAQALRAQALRNGKPDTLLLYTAIRYAALAGPVRFYHPWRIDDYARWLNERIETVFSSTDNHE